MSSLRVLIAGGGVAGLEGALALRDLAGDRVEIALLAPGAEFVYRPLTVREPFGMRRAQRYPIDELARDIGAELYADSFRWLDPAAGAVHTAAGETLEYDALLLALGARLREPFRHALTIDDRRIDDQLHGLLQDVEGGHVRHIAFLAPAPMPWPLPIYELALMTAGRAYDMGVELEITIATPEDRPLAVFGAAVSEAVEKLLERRNIAVETSAYAEVHDPGVVTISPGGRHLHADRIVALPQLIGPSTPGVPGGPLGGFIPIDEHCRVQGLDRVYAAGDATNFAVKHGGVAAQQADAAAEAIAALAGAPLTPAPFRPEIHAILLGGDKPLYLSAKITGGHGCASRVSEVPDSPARAKLEARYLGPYLEAHDRAAGRVG